MTRCDRCKFYKAEISQEDADPAGTVLVYARGECRRYAPQRGKWAKVRADDWCGDFELA